MKNQFEKNTGVKTRLAGLVMSVILMITLLNSCSKDDEVAVKSDTPNEKNAAVIDGEKFNTPNSYVFDYGKPFNYNSRDFDVDFSNGTWNGQTYSPNTTTIVTIDLNSSSQTEIAEGTYTLNKEEDASGSKVRHPMTFVRAYAWVNLTYSNGDFQGGTRYDDLIDGSVIVKKTTDGYKIDYDLKFENAINLKGHYSGKLQYFN